jgi:HEAT repeat protein
VGFRRLVLLGTLLTGCGIKSTDWASFDPQRTNLVASINEHTVAERQSTVRGSPESSQIIYLAHRGDVAAALQQYQLYQMERGHDYGLVRAVAAAALKQAFDSSDNEMQSVALFGAALSGDRALLRLLGEALEDPAVERQMQAVSLLSGLDEEGAGRYLQKALASPLPQIRLEAIFGIARRGEDAAPHLVPLLEYGEPVQLAACELLSSQDTPPGNALLRRLFVASKGRVRAAALFSCGLKRRDDFLPQIRQALTHIDGMEQEAACSALGLLNDTSSVASLQAIAKAKRDPAIHLAALGALYQLGDRTVRPQVEQLALQGNRFAISLLGRMEGSEPTLLTIASSADTTNRIIASLALLERRHTGCWPGLSELLLHDARDLLWLQERSPGFSLVTWKRVTSAEQTCATQPHLFHAADRWRFEALLEASQLPAATFLQIAQAILQTNQNELVLVTVRILERLGDEGKPLLRRMSEQAGAPFVRTACHLALLRMGEEGHQERLLLWLAQNQHHPLQLRQLLRPDTSELFRVTLTPDERSQLLLDISSALAAHPNAAAIHALLDMLAHAHPTVRVAVAACLLQSLV